MDARKRLIRWSVGLAAVVLAAGPLGAVPPTGGAAAGTAAACAFDGCAPAWPALADAQADVARLTGLCLESVRIGPCALPADDEVPWWLPMRALLPGAAALDGDPGAGPDADAAGMPGTLYLLALLAAGLLGGIRRGDRSY